MWDKFKSVAIGAGIAAGGAVAAYGIDQAAIALAATSLGPYGPLIGAAASIAINVVRKGLEKEKAKQETTPTDRPSK